MSSPSVPSGNGTSSELVDAIANKVLDSLRFRIERLIDQELSVTPPRKGRKARESSIVQPDLELYDQVTGEMIFG